MKNLIVLDIGTQFIKAAILGIDKKEKRGIIKAWTKDFFLHNKAAVCRKIIKVLEKKSKIKTEEVFLGLESNILKGKTITNCFRRENPNRKIDLAELKYLIQKIEWRALDNIRKELVSETEFLDTDARLIDAFINNINVDGHSISDPIGFQGQNICLSIFNIYTSIKWLDEIKLFVSGLGLKLIGLVPIPYALFHLLDLEKSPKGSALIIDVGAKITEVTFIKNGGEAVETKNFHLGGQAFSRVLAEFLGLDLIGAEIVKAKYSKGEISSGVKKKIEKLFIPNLFSWLNGVRVILSDFIKEYKSLPVRVFLCGNGSRLPMIENGLRKEKGLKINNNLQSEEASIQALMKLYLDLPEENDVFPSVFKRIIKLIQG